MREQKIYRIKEIDKEDFLCSILVSKGEVYSGTLDGDIYTLEDDLVATRVEGVKTLMEHNGDVFDAGFYGLYNTSTNTELISQEEKRRSGIETFNSLIKDNNLYALVRFSDKTHGIISLPERKGKLSIGETILNYDNKPIPSTQAVLLPGRIRSNSREYPFSVLSCVYKNYLDLNGEKIKGTEVMDGIINRISVLSSTSDFADVVYSGFDLHAVYRAGIDLRKRRADVSILIDGLSDIILALFLVYDKNLHQELILG